MIASSFSSQIIKEIPYLRAFAISLSGSYSKADDLVQETLLKAWTHADSFEAGTNLRAWLMTILRNSYFGHLRKMRRETEDPEGARAGKILVDVGQESRVDMNDIHKAIFKLPAEQREVLLMIGIAEFSYDEAAEVCGVAVGTVKSRLHRSRANLAAHLALNEPDSTSSRHIQDSKFAARRPALVNSPQN
jgi:RNA polymerase sigma-70 factor (ECF subfamily)